jgi:hypothetical protein
MGGGIAYQSAWKGVPVVMKDINDKSLTLGMTEAAKLLNKQLERGKIDGLKLAGVISTIQPTLEYSGFDRVDVVVEAVVENPKVKKAVLAETEDKVRPDTVLASNTSTIPISELASVLKRPENFCGMHFFNPVHRMPLVEVIRGEKTSDKPLPKWWPGPAKWAKRRSWLTTARLLRQPRAVPLLRRFQPAAARRRGLPQSRQSDGETVRLADGPGLSAGRGRH